MSTGNAAVPATVHAALVALTIWGLQLLASALGVNLAENTITELATVIVAYILSLAELALFNRGRGRGFAIYTDDYRPPFT